MIEVKAYIDLSLIVHVVMFLISMVYAMILNEAAKHSYSYKSHSFFGSLIAFMINLYYIPFFYLFYSFIRFFILFFIKRKWIKTEIWIHIFYYLNVGFLLLVGGSFIYEGILYINQPITTLFVFVLPLLTCIVLLIEKKGILKLKQQRFIYHAKLILNEETTFKIKGFLDTGNSALHLEKPVLFVNFSLPESKQKEKITIQGIQGQKKLWGYQGILFFQKKKIECYVIYLSTLELKNHCNCLLNVHLLTKGEKLC